MNQYTGNIDLIEIGNSFVIVDGWFVSNENRSTPRDVLISIDGNHFSSIKKLTIRQDLIDSGLTTGASRFRVDLPLNEVLSENFIVTLFSPESKSGLQFRNIPTRQFSPLGAIDRADSVGIEGWVYDPSMWHRGIQPSIIIDESISIPVALTLERHDVAAALGIESRPVGFSIRGNTLSDAVREIRSGATAKCTSIRLQLLSGQTTIIDTFFKLNNSPMGNLETFRDSFVRGWAIDVLNPEKPASVEIQIDGIHYLTVDANNYRADLAERGYSQNVGGFCAPIPMNPTKNEFFEVTALLSGSSDKIGNTVLRVHDVPRPSSSLDWYGILHDQNKNSRGITVIIPVYNAFDELSACLTSLKQHTTLPCHLLIIDDASPDPKIGALLAEAASWPQTTILRNERNVGFVQTCNRGLGYAAGSDVVLLNSDTVVGPRWLENLRLAAYSRRRVATATPLSDNAGVFSAPEPNCINVTPPSWSSADMTRFVGQASASLLPTVPTGHGFCLFIRRDCLDEIGYFDAEAFPRGYGEENDFCMRALRAGYSHIMDDRSFVQHKRSASFKEEKKSLYEPAQTVLRQRYPEYKPLTRSFDVGGPILTVRWRLRNALKDIRQSPRMRILFVISSDTGGTPQTNQDLMKAISDRYEPWLLQSNSKTISLFRFCGITNSRILIDKYHLDTHVEMSTHKSECYSRAVAEILVRNSFELVHIRHIGWHGLDLIDICCQLSIPVVFSFHDFYTICPSIKLIDSACMACCLNEAYSDAPCEAELWPGDNVPVLKPTFLGRWREMMAGALAKVSAFVTTSTEAKQRLCQTYPFLQLRDFRIIPHGRDFPAMRSLNRRKAADEPLRVLVPGNISRAKGAWLIRDVAAIDRGQNLEFHILGNSGQLHSGLGIVCHGTYARDDFTIHVNAIRPHIGAIFSRWPETYCHTLTEMWACGIPVFGTEIGAVGERIRKHGGGWLHSLADSPEQVLSELIQLSANAAEIDVRQAEVQKWQKGHGRDNNCSAMAAQYDVLYTDILENERVFKASKS